MIWVKKLARKGIRSYRLMGAFIKKPKLLEIVVSTFLLAKNFLCGTLRVSEGNDYQDQSFFFSLKSV